MTRPRSRASGLVASLFLAAASLLVPACGPGGGGAGGGGSGLRGGGAPPPGSTRRTPEVVVHLLSGTTSTLVAAAAAPLGWVVSWSAPASSLWVLRPTGSLSAPIATVIGTLAVVPGVRAVEENLLFTVDGPGGKQSQAPVFEDDFTLATMVGQPALRMIDAVPVPESSSPLVAVIDGGFAPVHEALPFDALAAGYDARDGDADPTDRGDRVDGDGDGRVDGGLGHGTAVAALVLTVAPAARVSLVRALDDEGDGSTATLAAALDWATAHGAQVINVSAGADGESAILDHFVAAARDRGIAVVAAAGNGDGRPVCYPASSAHAVAVAGVAPDGRPDPTSNRGPEVAAAAPSVDVVAPHPAGPDAYGRWRGTSFSTALFSGAVAQLLVAEPGPGALAAADALLDALAPFPPSVPPAEADGMGGGILDVGAGLSR